MGLKELIKQVNDNVMLGVIEAMVEKPPDEQLGSPFIMVGKKTHVLMRDWTAVCLHGAPARYVPLGAAAWRRLNFPCP